MRAFALFALGSMLFGFIGSAQADRASDCQKPSEPALAIPACTAEIEGGGVDTVWALNNRGLARAAKGDLLGAIADYDRALSIDPDHAPTLSNRGNAHAVLGDMLKALADHDRAVAIDPDYVAAWHNRGVDHEELGQYRDALNDYRKAISLSPGHRGSHIGLATANCKLGRVKASTEARLVAIQKGLIDAIEMQELLQAEGFYKGAIDGLFGKGSRAALWAWTRNGCLAGA